jgi:uncharacterized protein
MMISEHICYLGNWSESLMLLSLYFTSPMLDLLLVMVLGFLGSFGHCVGMCGPITLGFALFSGQGPSPQPSFWGQLRFHSLLNLGRLLSYTLVGAVMGGLGSVVIASGQLAGIDSQLRQGLALVTGGMMIWMGLVQLRPKLLPRLPLPHGFTSVGIHQRLQDVGERWRQTGWLPLVLGLVWGLIPCGFLYAAQIKAASTSSFGLGAATMLAFGLGTLPSMLGLGLFAARLSADHRSQLFRLGSWLLLLLGGMTLLRTGNMGADLTGHGAIACLLLALVARPISRVWPGLLVYRRLLGISAFSLALLHALQMLQHSLNWNLQAIQFMLPEHHAALWAGVAALLCMLPAAVTSFDSMVQRLGSDWRRLHLLAVPGLILAIGHTLGIGSSYFGSLTPDRQNWLAVTLLIGVTVTVLLLRYRWFWQLWSLERFYAPVLASQSSTITPTGTATKASGTPADADQWMG